MARMNSPGPGWMLVRGITQESEGPMRYLRGSAEIETDEFLLRADEIDYNEATDYAEARGNVHFQRFASGEVLECQVAQYYLKTETGRFYEVKGQAQVKMDPRQGILTTTSPFVFQGKFADRKGGRYILYDGFVTNCRIPRPWWVLEGPKFDIIPGDRAIAYHSKFRLKRVPLFYTPAFYKSLEKEPRRSGFLMPSIGNSNRRGKMVAVGYYWAINRSHDLTYRAQYFTQRGLAHHVDMRGKPTAKSDYDLIVYGVNDRGLKQDNGERLKQGGFLVNFLGKTDDLPFGFRGRGEAKYLSSFTFRQAFTESFNEAVFSEVHSRGFVGKHWSTYALNIAAERIANYQTSSDGDRIVIRRLPMLDFSTRDRRVFRRGPPVWWSLESTAGAVRRNQPLFQTRQFVERIDIAPRLMTALRWKDFSLIPSIGIRETHWGASQRDGRVSGDGVLRSTRELGAELNLPSIARVFDRVPGWLGGTRLGEKMKHVVETRAGFRWVSGVDDFSKPIRFDETELLTNTREIDYSITNRLYVKRGGTVSEVLSWQLWQKKYLDPTLGGAIVDGQRNVFLTQTELTSYAFFDRARSFSPVVSALRLTPAPAVSVEWRSDYDAQRHRIVNSGIYGIYRHNNWSMTAGHNMVRSNPRLTPSANQLVTLLGWARPDLRRWNFGFQTIYDFRQAIMQYASSQVGYNTDCCGLSFQYRRFGFANRNENQWRVAFAVANLGSFGNLRRQERMF